MQLDQSPFFRKAITPWYDSTFSCWVLMLFMALVFGFSLAGVAVALGDEKFTLHVWLPWFLASLSGGLAVKIFIRLRTRSNTA